MENLQSEKKKYLKRGLYQILMKHNASLLSLLTISSVSGEHIILMHLKELDDIAPNEIHWYKKRGFEGKSEWLWKKKKIRQWLLVGEDSIVRDIFNSCIEKQVLEFKFGNVTINFIAPKLRLQEEIESIYAIGNIPGNGASNQVRKYNTVSPTVPIDFLLNEKLNCSCLEGYSFSSEINPLYPPGILPENTLIDNMNQLTLAIVEYRFLYIDFKGFKNEIVSGNPTELTGFIQTSMAMRAKIEVVVKDLAGDNLLGVSPVDSAKGAWRVKLNQPVGRGQILLRNTSSKEIISGEKFYLIKNINFDTQVVTTVITDLFNRQISIIEKEYLNKPIHSLIWDFYAAIDTLQSKIDLSDKLSTLMLSMDRSITFVDPYFFGDIKNSENGLQLGEGQQVFINALMIALVKGNIQEINILGYWQRAKKQTNSDKIGYIRNYRRLYTFLCNILGEKYAGKLKSFKLIISKEPFHDRYWVGTDNIYYLSNSINGAFESRELIIRREDEITNLKVRPKFNRRIEEGELYDLTAEDVL